MQRMGAEEKLWLFKDIHQKTVVPPRTRIMQAVNVLSVLGNIKTTCRQMEFQ